MERRAIGRAATIGAALCLFSSVSLAGAEVTQEGNLRVSFTGGIAPHSLPRQGLAPVEATLGGEIKTTDAWRPAR
jgi:hypothetical protein